MDLLDLLHVRFHFNSRFVGSGRKMKYCDGSEGMSYIERDKVSMPEILGHLRDHCIVGDQTMLHWLFPGKELHDGLQLLYEDKACQNMSQCIGDGGVADIYVENRDGQQEIVISGSDSLVAESASRAKFDKDLMSLRKCARHIYANWKKEFNNKDWQKRFWRCAKAPCTMLFKLARERLARETPAGAQAIMNTHPQHWSRAWFKLGSNCDSVDNNMCESFNKWIVEARFFPIITMLETIRTKVMVRIAEQKAKGERWETRICPNILKKLNTYITLSGNCHAVANGESKFEVKHYDHRFTVNLATKECSCRYWQLSGLPCPHAISCIYFLTNSLDDYTANCYSMYDFNETYKHCLQPVEGMTNWPSSDRPPLVAPGYVRLPGRPKKERRREATEKPKATKMSKIGSVIRCSKCKRTGHNRSTCDRYSGGGQTASATNVGSTAAAQPPPNAVVIASTSDQTCSTSKKRKSTAPGTISTIGEMQPANKAVNRSSAKARVEGSAIVQVSPSSVSIDLKSGKASAQVDVSKPTKKKLSPRRRQADPVMFVPPWDTAKL